MTWLSDSTQQLAGAWRSSAYAGHGIRGDAVPQTGVHGPSILWGAGANISLPAEAADEFRALILTRPVGLPGLVIGEDSAVEVPEDSPAGTHVGTWRGYKGAAIFGPDPSTYSIVIGGSVLTGGATLDDVSAGGGLGVAPPSGLGGGATLDDVAAGGGIVGGGITRPPAPAPFYPQLRRTVRLTEINPDEVPDLSAIAPGDTITLVFDFAPYVTMTNPVLTIERVGGDDGLAPLAKVGPGLAQGGLVLQRYTAPLASLGNTYRVSCTATAEDNSVLTATGRLPVRIG